MIVHLTADLMLASTVREAAQTAGRPAILIRSLPELSQQLAKGSLSNLNPPLAGSIHGGSQTFAQPAASFPALLVCVDLQTAGLDLSELGQIAASQKNVRFVLYAQHVQDERIEEARQKVPGADVISRGQFFRNVARLIGPVNG